MVLVVDIGNSNIVMGGYSSHQLCFCARLATSHQMEADQYAIQLRGILSLYHQQDTPIDGIMISSVVPRLTSRIISALSHFTDAAPLLLNYKNTCGIEIEIENPAELGMDILASAIAVKHSFPLPAVIIDMGTATKLTAIDKNGRLLGVAIAPGLFVSLDALIKGTSLLQGIPLEAPRSAIGKNTADSMKSGIVLGTAAMLDGMIDRFEETTGPIQTVIATGGAAPIIVPNCRHSIQFSETLLLEGLYHAYQELNS